MAEDYYERLGVDPDATESAIRRAYRTKATEIHPDVSDAADAEARFKALARAKAVLTDPASRRTYDRLGHDRFVEREANGTGRRGPTGGAVPQTVDDHATDPWRRAADRPAAFRSPGDPGALAGPWRRSSPFVSSPGPVEVDLRSAFRGHRRARVDRPPADASETTDCPRCRGRGTVVHVIDTGAGRRRRLEPCGACRGTGSDHG